MSSKKINKFIINKLFGCCYLQVDQLVSASDNKPIILKQKETGQLTEKKVD